MKNRAELVIFTLKEIYFIFIKYMRMVGSYVMQKQNYESEYKDHADKFVEFLQIEFNKV